MKKDTSAEATPNIQKDAEMINATNGWIPDFSQPTSMRFLPRQESAIFTGITARPDIRSIADMISVPGIRLIPVFALLSGFISMLLLLALITPVVAQDNGEFDVPVRLGARYVPDTGIELRIFPGNRQTLIAGFRQGFVIERKADSERDFTEIARVQPWSAEVWENAINEAGNPSSVSYDTTTADYLDLALAFHNNAMSGGSGTFSFEDGIGELVGQKGDEDFQFAVFILTSVRNSRVSEALGLAYTDPGAEPGRTYEYRARPVLNPEIYRVVPEPVVVTASNDPDAYDIPVFVYEGDTMLNFAWEESEKVSGFYVERKDAPDQKFVRLNEAPIHNLSGAGYDGIRRGSYSDEDLENYKVYNYRFLGYTMFGELVTFAEVEAMPRDRTPPEAPFLVKPEHAKPDEVHLRWHMNDNPAPDLSGFVVARSTEPEGNFRILHADILPAEAREFVDTTFVTGQPNYYLVQAVDTAWNVSSSFPVAVTLIDTIPPAQPVFLSGTVDSAGVVTLVVETGEESDLMGYRLYRANDASHEFSVIREAFVDIDSLHHQVQTVFADTITLNSLTPNIYYRIRALDFNHNPSEFSEMMVIARPDTIPPVTPVFKRVLTRADAVELHFALSESRDVAAQKIYRRLSADEPWTPLDSLQYDQTVFTDTLVTQGTSYHYSLRAVDYSGNRSEFAHPVVARPYDSGVRPPVENLMLQLDEDERIVNLTWEYSLQGDEVFFVVYRQDDHGRFIQHRRTDDRRFSESIRDGVVGTYAIKAFTTDGGQSVLSEVLAAGE
jgi:uncharacterized protein